MEFLQTAEPGNRRNHLLFHRSPALSRCRRHRIATAERRLYGSNGHQTTRIVRSRLPFAQAEGIIPAPESCHAIAATVREANKCKETGEEKVILFNLSGHGLIDMASYDKYLAGDLQNYELTDNDIRRNLDEIGNLV